MYDMSCKRFQFFVIVEALIETIKLSLLPARMKKIQSKMKALEC